MNKVDFKNAEERINSVLSSDKAKSEKFQQVCEILKEEIYHYDWVGFYHLNESTNILELGEFVGKPTEHTKIPIGKGVCGQVAKNNKTMVVQDVTQLENYISCGLEVQSEIVVPIRKNGQFISELDIDSHATAPFRKEDEEFLEGVCNQLEELF